MSFETFTYISKKFENVCNFFFEFVLTREMTGRKIQKNDNFYKNIIRLRKKVNKKRKIICYYDGVKQITGCLLEVSALIFLTT